MRCQYVCSESEWKAAQVVRVWERPAEQLLKFTARRPPALPSPACVRYGSALLPRLCVLHFHSHRAGVEPDTTRTTCLPTVQTGHACASSSPCQTTRSGSSQFRGSSAGWESDGRIQVAPPVTFRNSAARRTTIKHFAFLEKPRSQCHAYTALVSSRSALGSDAIPTAHLTHCTAA